MIRRRARRDPLRTASGPGPRPARARRRPGRLGRRRARGRRRHLGSVVGRADGVAGHVRRRVPHRPTGAPARGPHRPGDQRGTHLAGDPDAPGTGPGRRRRLLPGGTGARLPLAQLRRPRWSSLCRELGVRMVVGLGAFPAPAPHTRPVRLAATAPPASADLVAEIGIVQGEIDVPSGVWGALELALGEADIAGGRPVGPGAPLRLGHGLSLGQRRPPRRPGRRGRTCRSTPRRCTRPPMPRCARSTT